jgi:hypothetical protein
MAAAILPLHNNGCVRNVNGLNLSQAMNNAHALAALRIALSPARLDSMLVRSRCGALLSVKAMLALAHLKKKLEEHALADRKTLCPAAHAPAACN